MAIIRRLNSPLDARSIDLLIEAAGAKARDSFADFRRFLHPEMLWGWWTQDMAEQLQQFYEDLRSGRRPKLALLAPPPARQIVNRYRFHRLGRSAEPGSENDLCVI